MNILTFLLLGPLLALIPIFIWELAIKPARVRRNLAMLLVTELELNLEEIAYWRLCLETDPDTRPASMLLPRTAFAAVQTVLAELSARDLRDVVRFYSITAKIDATQAGLMGTQARLEGAPDGDKPMLSAAISAGSRALERRLAEAWTIGLDARASLDDVVRSSWMDAPPQLEDEESIRAAAQRRRG